MRIPVVLFVFAVTASCAAPPPTDAVAHVDGHPITLAEVDARWRELDPSQELRTQQAMYDGRRDALDVIIADRLLTKAAQSRGLTLQQYLAQEIPPRIRAVTAADIESFYAANRERMDGQPLEEARMAIGSLLQSGRQTEARESLLKELGKGGGSTQISLEPPRQHVEIASTDPARGPRSARVTIVEFSDYECPFCGRLAPVLARVRSTYGDRVRIVWKDFPLDEIHPEAVKLAEAARCAGDQGKYWEFHDRVFADQKAAAHAPLDDHARALGIPAAPFMACVSTRKFEKAIADAQSNGQRLGVESTPMLFINGRPLAGAQPFDTLARVIDDELVHAPLP